MGTLGQEAPGHGSIPGWDSWSSERVVDRAGTSVVFVDLPRINSRNSVRPASRREASRRWLTLAKKEAKIVWDRNFVLICYTAGVATITLLIALYQAFFV